MVRSNVFLHSFSVIGILHIPVVMAEDEVTAAAAAGAQTYSQEYVNDLKAQIVSSKDRDARLQYYETRDRQALQAKQSLIEEYIGAEGDDPEIAPMKEWVKSMVNCSNLESTLPLANLLHSKACKWKRTIDEASNGKKISDELDQANRERDELRAELETTKKSKADLETMVKEKNDTIESLTNDINARGGSSSSRKWNFSQRSDREMNGVDSSSAGSNGTAGNSGASFSKMPDTTSAAFDPLLSFIKTGGSGSTRMMYSGTNHALLGNATAGMPNALLAAASSS